MQRQRQVLRRTLAALAEHLDVGVTEAVDRLELVADEEDILGIRPAAQQVDEVALQPVRVLELVDHDRAEAQLLGLAHLLVVPQQVAREQLEVLEVERGLALLRGRVLGREQVEQLLQELAVARGELVERRLLEPVARVAERGGAVAGRRQVREVEQLLAGFEPSVSAAVADASWFAVASGSAASTPPPSCSSASRSATPACSPSSSFRSRPAERSVS